MPCGSLVLLSFPHHSLSIFFHLPPSSLFSISAGFSGLLLFFFLSSFSKSETYCYTRETWQAALSCINTGVCLRCGDRFNAEKYFVKSPFSYAVLFMFSFKTPRVHFYRYFTFKCKLKTLIVIHAGNWHIFVVFQCDRILTNFFFFCEKKAGEKKNVSFSWCCKSFNGVKQV